MSRDIRKQLLILLVKKPVAREPEEGWKSWKDPKL